MFVANQKHLQVPMFSTLDELKAESRKRLENSWAGTFRREVFGRLDERPFAVLYADVDSRPNTPVNVLMGLETLRTGFGWTNEEMYEAYQFNLQVRYAVGYENLDEGYFALRTMYNFRNRLSEHMQKTGENLVEKAFEQVTDEQIAALALVTTDLRVDSTQIASDICTISRLQLLVEVLGRVHRMLKEADKQSYAELLGSYVKEKASQYIYRLKSGEYGDRIAAVGAVMQRLLVELAPKYTEEMGYQLLKRVFGEHFVWTDEEQRAKEKSELRADSLQSPDDWEATYRQKQGDSYRGYVGNITETCHPDNPVQLIVKVQTESNVVDDEQMLIDALPNLQERTDVENLYTDGGYNGSALDQALAGTDIRHIQSAIRGGRTPDGFLSLADFEWETTDDGQPAAFTCPQGQTILVEPGRSENRFIARPDVETCTACPLLALCPLRPQSSQRTPSLYFNLRSFLVARKRQLVAAFLAQPGNPRAAVESTVRCVKQPFRHGKVLVRGIFRVACALLSSAFMVNARRLHRLASQKRQNPTPSNPKSSVFALFSLLHALFVSILTIRWRFQPVTLSMTFDFYSSPFPPTHSLSLFGAWFIQERSIFTIE
jgi:hypothetical protein